MQLDGVLNIIYHIKNIKSLNDYFSLYVSM